MIRRPVPLAANRNMVIGSVHGRTHQIHRAGIHADIIPVYFFLMDSPGHQPSAGARHPAAKFRLNAHLPIRTDLLINPAHAFTHGLNIRFRLLRPIGNTDAARKINESKFQPLFFRQRPSERQKQPGQLREIRGIRRIGGQERMKSKAPDSQRFQRLQAFPQLRRRETVLRLARVPHNGIADGKGSAGIKPQAHALRNAAVRPQQLNIRKIIQINPGAQFPGLAEFFRRHGVGRQNHLFPAESAGRGQRQFRGGGTVQAAAFLLQDPQNGGIRKRLHRKILPEIPAPGKSPVQRPRTVPDFLFIIQMKRGRKLFRSFQKNIIVPFEVWHPYSLPSIISFQR